MASQAVDQASLGAWLLKSSPDSSRGDWLATGFTGVSTRCVRRTYRADLVAAGQPVLLWFSGEDQAHPAGIYAQGWTTGGVVTADDDAVTMPVALDPVAPAVLRRELLEHPVLSRIEVVRMAAGSNPSFLSRAQLDALRQTWPQVTVG